MKNGIVVAHVPAVERERGEQDVARRGRRGAQRPPHRAGARGRQRRRVPDRQVAADHGHAEQVRRPRDPVEHALGVRAVRAHQHVDERQRTAAHRAHVGDVRDDRGGAGAERVGEQERRRDRLAADDEVSVAVRHERRVVAVDAGAEPVDQGDVALAEEAGRRSDGLDQRLEVHHRRD